MSATAEPSALEWGHVLAQVIDGGHLVTGHDISVLVDTAVRRVGLRAELLIADLAQQMLVPVQLDPGPQLAVVGTLAGRAFQLGEILLGREVHGGQQLLVPVLDGTDRIGVLQVGLSDEVSDNARLRAWLWTLASLVGHIVASKIVYSDHLRRLSSNGSLSPAAELLWQLLPPRTFATDQVVVSALLEPHDRIGGDAYDYNSDGPWVDLAVFDAVGHDLSAGLTTALAITAIRNGRRAGETDLPTLAERADHLLVANSRNQRFVTAVLVRLNTRTGSVAYLLAGHPPPLLVRGGRVVKRLSTPPRPPLGVSVPGRTATVGREQLEPDDRLLLYSDGITEARNARGEFFGEQRLVELTEHASAGQISAPETLRRLGAAVLAHQNGQLQDDATLLLVDWSTTAHQRMFPS